MIVSLVLGFTVCVVCYLIQFARKNYGKLDGLGFPVIPPKFLLGSVPDIHKTVQQHDDIERFHRYGPVWGLYQGRTPLIFVADPDLIRQIFVKDTAHFFDRESFDFGNPIVNEILDYLPGEKWKKMRVTQTKLFSSGKIKQYSNNMNDSMVKFVKQLNLEMSKSPAGRVKIDTRERFCTYTVDAIGRCLFSMQIEPSESNEFYVACKRLIGDGQSVSSFYRWTLVFPFLSRFEPTLVLDPNMPETFLNLMRLRKSSVNQKQDDYITIMSELMESLSTPDFRRLGITETTLLGQATNLFLAGFDRISTTMSFLAYHLAKDQEAQSKLYEEIKSIVEEKHNGRIDYETLSEMSYLNACITEVSRLYPTFIRPERVCNKDWECPEKGIKIPKGITVMIPSWAANRNPEIYDDPDEFKPERFMQENKGNINPYAYTSFGFGHRNCIGMRFAYESMRVGICHLFKNYRFETRADTKINFKPGLIMIVQFDPIYLDAVKRD